MATDAPDEETIQAAFNVLLRADPAAVDEAVAQLRSLLDVEQEVVDVTGRTSIRFDAQGNPHLAVRGSMRADLGRLTATARGTAYNPSVSTTVQVPAAVVRAAEGDDDTVEFAVGVLVMSLFTYSAVATHDPAQKAASIAEAIVALMVLLRMQRGSA